MDKPPGHSKPNPPSTRNTNPRLRKDLIAGLEHLRSETKEISRIYVANLQRDLVQLIDFINSIESVQQNHRRSILAKFEQMKETLDDLSLKPEKGRRKDLRRIEQAIRSMMKLAFSKNANG
jgi:hypothetical protein